MIYHGVKNAKNILITINRGNGWMGQLGYNNIESWQFSPKKVEALADEFIVEVACGEGHTCAVTSTGSIFTFETPRGHAQNDPFLKPKLLQDLSSKGVVSMSASQYRTDCVTTAGEVTQSVRY